MDQNRRRGFYRDLEHEWVRRNRFVEIRAAQLIELCKSQQAVENIGGPPPAWIFDLDSTLFCVSTRMKWIFSRYLRQHPQAPNHWHWALAQLHPENHMYGVESTFRKIFADRDSSQAASWARELWKDFEPFWTEHFFSNPLIALDEAYEGAVEFVKEIHGLGCDIIYLTGRDRPRTGAGTVQALRRAAFPWDTRTHLVMKPSREISDLQFKYGVTRMLNARFRVQVSIDNEPENLVMFAREFKNAEIVFFHSIMSKRVPSINYSEALGERKAWRMEGYL